MLRTLFSATILAGALAGSAMAQARDAGCALPSEPKGIPAAIDAAISGPADKDRACMKALLIPEARMMFVSLGADGAPTYTLQTLDDWIARVKARGHTMLEEKQLKFHIERYGNIAHLWSSYALYSDGKQVARVNRVFRDKPGGLVVDYLGLADQLKYALATYTQSGGKGEPSIDTAKAVAAMQEKHEIACGMMHGFDWSKWHTGTPAEKMALLPGAQEHILKQENGKERFIQVVTELSQAFALCAGTEEAIAIRDDIGFFQQIKIALAKPRGERKSTEDLDHAVRQLVAKAIAPEGAIIDVFQAAGLKQPDISILSDQFLSEVRGLKYKNVAAELLAKLLGDEIKLRSKRNLVQSREFSEMLKKTLNAYHNRAIATQEVIEELIKLAKQLTEADKRGVDLGLNDDEVAFYDALAANNSALEVMGKDNLKVIATQLVTQVRKSVTIDWTLRESARAKIKVLVKRILRKHGYPPDLQDEATKLVLAQAELLCAEWAA